MEEMAKLEQIVARPQYLDISILPCILPSPKKPIFKFFSSSQSNAKVFKFTGWTKTAYGDSKIPRSLANKSINRLDDHKSIYKFRVNKDNIKNKKFLRGVRLNRRFHLLMQYRYEKQDF